MQAIETKLLYEQDFALWITDTVAKLKSGDIDRLDLENLIEEVAALGRAERHELENRLRRLLEHLLKRCYVDSAYDNCGWQLTIREQRDRLQRLLKQSPSLRRALLEDLPEAYMFALQQVRIEYARVAFPDRYPFSDDIDMPLTEDFWETGSR
jgi:hypothetical protein